jgi:signal transduction histidine kinase
VAMWTMCLRCVHGAAEDLDLFNMRRRAEKLHGMVEIETPETGGTLLIRQVPVRS